MKMYKNLLVSVLLSTALAGCSMFGGDEMSGGSDATNGTSGVNTSGVDSGSAYTGHPLDDPSNPLSTKVIYFEFDSSAVASQYESVLAAHGAYLAANPGVSVVLEGHADERGTREYNIALSERRAKGVQNLISLQGAGRNQSEVVGFGEEKPASLGHDEQSWQLNRRVEIVYPAH
ncbi:MAG: peptidoglycan-associated lipoprotein [Piscirickettsiaceae bacterium]|nr:MAG: peptidoglycan-associated lipoprotein [Piscirickettsiaceae bacterium]